MVSTNIQKCQICQGDIVTDQVTMESCCNKCGLVIDAPAISLEPEQLSSPGEPSKSRTGSKTSNKFHDFGLSTNINEQNKDAAGNVLSSHIRTQILQMF